MPSPEFEQLFVSGIQQFSAPAAAWGLGAALSPTSSSGHICSPAPGSGPPALPIPQMGMCASEEGFVTPGRWLDSSERRIAAAAIYRVPGHHGALEPCNNNPWRPYFYFRYESYEAQVSRLESGGLASG